MTAQWTAGVASNSFCDTHNNPYEATSLTYTTQPMAADTKVTGLITANLWATASTTDATLVAVLSEVEGSCSPASALSVRNCRPTGRHLMIRPWHPFTKESQHGVTPGEPTEYNVEIDPTSNIVKAGNRLRLTIGTAGTVSTLTPLPSLGQELGGTITVLHNASHPSNVLLPFAP